MAFISKSEAILESFLCSVISFVTSLRLLRFYHDYIGTPGCICRGLKFSSSCKRQDLYIRQYHTSIPTFHKSGIHIISIFQHSSIATTITSILTPQHVIFFKICKRTFPCVPFFISLFSRMLSSTFAILRWEYVFCRIIHHLQATSFGECFEIILFRTLRKGM